MAGRPKTHTDNAEKQRAYRERKALRNSPDVSPIPIGKDGTPIYYSETGTVLNSPRTLICRFCLKKWMTIRPEIKVWECQPATCLHKHPEMFDGRVREQLPDDEY